MKKISIVAVLLLILPLFADAKNSGKSYLLPISDEVKEQIVALHNKYRAEVGVPPVVWSDDVAEGAGEWALHLAENEGLRMVHSTFEQRKPYGENLSGGPGQWSTDKDALTALQWAVESFGNEKKFYKNKPIRIDNDFYKYGHYTQMVWRTTTEIGCAVAKRKDIPGYIVVCRYNPSGNMVGQKAY
jgi:hypothetical protein